MILVHIVFVFVWYFVLTGTDYTNKKLFYVLDGLIFSTNLAIVLLYFF